MLMYVNIYMCFKFRCDLNNYIKMKCITSRLITRVYNNSIQFKFILTELCEKY